MEIIEVIILGLVQGLTEFIPVSSSGHLVIFNNLFGNEGSSLAFDVALHMGTLVSLLYYFRTDIVGLARNLFANNEQGRLARLLILATIPAAVAGLILTTADDETRTATVAAIMLILGALLMLYAERKPATKEVEITTKRGLQIGFVQVLALIPGMSRSGITITAGMLSGLTREQAARFSFLMAIPIVAGSALGIVLSDSTEVTNSTSEIIVGMIVAAASGLFAIRFLLGFVAKSSLKAFAYYRIILAVVVLLSTSLL